MNDTFYIGQYNENDASDKRGWIVGHFMESLPQKTDHVEVKHWSYPVGKSTHEPKVQEAALEVTFILKGRAHGFIGDTPIELSAGQYFVITPGVRSNTIEYIDEEIEGITIKTPSVEGDTKR